MRLCLRVPAEGVRESPPGGRLEDTQSTKFCAGTPGTRSSSAPHATLPQNAGRPSASRTARPAGPGAWPRGAARQSGARARGRRPRAGLRLPAPREAIPGSGRLRASLSAPGGRCPRARGRGLGGVWPRSPWQRQDGASGGRLRSSSSAATRPKGASTATGRGRPRAGSPGAPGRTRQVRWGGPGAWGLGRRGPSCGACSGVLSWGAGGFRLCAGREEQGKGGVQREEAWVLSVWGSTLCSLWSWGTLRSGCQRRSHARVIFPPSEFRRVLGALAFAVPCKLVGTELFAEAGPREKQSSKISQLLEFTQGYISGPRPQHGYLLPVYVLWLSLELQFQRLKLFAEFRTMLLEF